MLHIDLHLTAFPRTDRMRFVAQEMVIRFLEPVRRARDSKGDIKAVREVLEAAQREARDGVALYSGGDLDAHLQVTVEKADAAWREWSKGATARLHNALNRSLAEFRSAVAAMRCAHCLHDDLCRGIVLPDEPRKSIVSPCLHALDQMARDVSDFTRDIYRRHVSALTLQNIGVDLYVAPLSDDARRVTGATAFARPNGRFDLAGSARRVWIEIGLPLAEFDTPQYFSLLYVMAHELAVHAVQQLLRDESPDPPRRVAFAEGLIDRVVFEELVEAVRARKMSRIAFLPTRAIGAVTDFHITRKDEQEEDKALWRTDLGFGQDAYEFLLRVGEFVVRSSPRGAKGAARDWAHGTALSLNVMGAAGWERERIARGLGELVDMFARPADDITGWPATKADWMGPFGTLILSLAAVNEYHGTGARQVLRALENLAQGP